MPDIPVRDTSAAFNWEDGSDFVSQMETIATPTPFPIPPSWSGVEPFEDDSPEHEGFDEDEDDEDDYYDDEEDEDEELEEDDEPFVPPPPPPPPLPQPQPSSASSQQLIADKWRNLPVDRDHDWMASKLLLEPGSPEHLDLEKDLQGLEDEFDAYELNRTSQLLSVTTRSIELEDVPLGAFKISVQIRLMTQFTYSRLTIEALHPNFAAGHDGVTHPHVQHSKLCAGDGGAAIQRAGREWRFYDLMMLVRSVLETYNIDSPYCNLEDWVSPATRCGSCGVRVSEDDGGDCSYDGCHRVMCDECASRCHACEDAVCSNHSISCRHCEEEFCNLHIAECGGGCDLYVCESCRVACSRCSTTSCPECLVTCAGCHDTVCGRRTRYNHFENQTGCMATRCSQCGDYICEDCREDVTCRCVTGREGTTDHESTQEEGVSGSQGRDATEPVATATSTATGGQELAREPITNETRLTGDGDTIDDILNDIFGPRVDDPQLPGAIWGTDPSAEL